MRILISGSGGLIGRSLTKAFLKKGWEPCALKRRDFALGEDDFSQKIGEHDVIINLAGAPIVKKWTRAYKQEMYQSRILTTRKIAEAIRKLKKNPGLFISASASGIYPEGKISDEFSREYSDSFLGRLCLDWEKEASACAMNTRLVIFRLGVVLDPDAGALEKMLPAFRFGLGGKVGTGKQMFPWIHIDDLVRAFVFIIEDDRLNGIFNLTSPQLITNLQFSKELGRALHRPAIIPVPAMLLKLIYGEAAVTLTTGQSVVPKRLLQEGFGFLYPECKPALDDLLNRKRPGLA
jgi:uncharacterized protein